MPSVLITGASGFIGSFLVEEALGRGFTVYAGIRSTSSRRWLGDPRIRFVGFDFSSAGAVVNTLEECKKDQVTFHYVIHNAGITKARTKDDFMRVNYGMTRDLIDGLRQTGLIPRKFILMSSLAAFGPGNPDTMQPVRLSDPPNPAGEYGKSKLEAEKYLQQQPDLPWIILRPTGVYGPREKDYYVFFRTISRGLETYIGSSKQALSFIYIRDLARLTFDALESPVSRRSYFVSDGRDYTAEDFAAIAKRHLGKKTLRIVVPAGMVRPLAFILEKTGSVLGRTPLLNTDKVKILGSLNWRCDAGPLQADFQFTARYTLDAGVKETLDWYKKEGWL
jgi:nucleoside-diphosphate-sugar epimerase